MNVRDAFIPDPGYKLAEFDYSQAELLIVLWLANDLEFKQALAMGKDLHTLNGSKLMDKPYVWVQENKSRNPEAKRIRYIGKKLNHAFNYSMGPTSLQRSFLTEAGMFLTLAECKQILTRMKSIRPAIDRWHQEIDKTVRTTRQLVTPLGMRYRFNGHITDETLRFAYAFIPQSTVGHLLNKAWINVYNTLGDTVDILLQVHDSLLIQYPESADESTLLPQIASLMLHPLTINGSQLIIPVDCKTGYNWGSLVDHPLA